MERIKIEDLNDRLVERVQEIYFNAEIQMINKVKKRVERGIKFEGYNEKKLKEIQELRKEIEAISKKSNSLVKRDINDGFTTIYKAGRENVSALPDNILKDTISYKLQRHFMAMDDILNGTSKHMVRNADDIYREVTGQSISGVMTGTDTLRQAAQKSLNQYAAKGITGFVDKAGRRWDLQSYATMATRTVANNIAKQGHIDRSVEMGRDLMIVSAHNGACPLCVPWSNKILSISGNNQKYPSLSDAESAGLFHPNCKHTLLAYDEEDAELDKMLGIEHGAEGADAVSEDTKEVYEATQKQRYNESQIRKWKRIEAASLNNTQAMVAKNKIAEYQYKNRELTDKYGLKRDYSREGNMVGKAGQAIKYKDYPKLKLEEQVVKEATEAINETIKNVSPEVKKMIGEKNLIEWDIKNKPNKYDPDDYRWGTEPGKYTVYRSGSLDRDIIFTGNEMDGVQWYTESFPNEIGDDKIAVKTYTVEIKNPFVSTDMPDAYKKLFNKKAPDTSNPDNWIKADERIMKAIKKKGYDAWTMTSPAPPAKAEMVLFKDHDMVQTSRVIPDKNVEYWEKQAKENGFWAHAFVDGKHVMTVEEWWKTEAYKAGKAAGKWN